MNGFGLTPQPVYIDNNNDHIKRRNLRFLQSPHCAANCPQHVCSSGKGKSRATYRMLIMLNMSCATWYEGTAQSSGIKFDRGLIAFILALVY